MPTKIEGSTKKAGSYIRTEEHKKAMSEKLKGRVCVWLIGKKRPPRSKEWCDKLSKANKGKRLGKDNHFFGKHHSIESIEKMRQKISKGLMGNKIRLGIKHKIEDKEKISKGLVGKFAKDKNPSWKGGITSPYKQIRYSLEAKKWRMEVFKRDNFTCKLCGDKKGGTLRAHHLASFSAYPNLRFDLNNGITLCACCHKLVHKIFGREPKVLSYSDWIRDIVAYAEPKNIPIFMKESLRTYTDGKTLKFVQQHCV